MMYNIWNCHNNAKTFDFDHSEWIIDGELGRCSYPGSWDVSDAMAHYRHGKTWNEHAEEHTYTITLGGKIYAFAMDLFCKTIFGIGRDYGKAAMIEKSTDDKCTTRNNAIRSICTPCNSRYDLQDQLNSTRAVYGGSLCYGD